MEPRFQTSYIAEKRKMFQVEQLGHGPDAEFAVVYRLAGDSGLLTVTSKKETAERLATLLNNVGNIYS